jgi:hypothetical protein
MKEIARQFAAYLWLLVKKWIFWLFAALDLAGAILVYGLYPQPELPRVVYWILPIIGLLWVNFQIYRDLAIPIDDRLRDVAETAAKDFEYWHFRKEKAAGISEQKLFSEWLIEKGVDSVSRDYEILRATISILKSGGFQVQQILKPEFFELIRQHDEPPRAGFA